MDFSQPGFALIEVGLNNSAICIKEFHMPWDWSFEWIPSRKVKRS
jgi:hypothetical protein